MSDASVASPRAPSAPATGRTKWFAIGALAVAAVAFLVITFGGIGQNLVYYWGPSDLRAAGDKAIGATIRLGGQVGPDSIRYGEGASSLEFDVVDGKATVHVKSRGVPPQMFREGIGVVVEGTMTRAGHFECNRLMVSHDNEYRAPGDGYKGDVKELMRTTQGLEAGGEEKPGR
jgi:cytochrome c-type biogenesis protein CcmE